MAGVPTYVLPEGNLETVGCCFRLRIGWRDASRTADETPALRKACHVFGLRHQALTNQALNLRPETRIAIALHVLRNEPAIDPGPTFALHRRYFVVETVVAKDLCLGVVGCANNLLSVDDSVGLIKVHSGGHVVGDNIIVLPGFGDTVDLNGQEYGNTQAVQIAGQHYDGGTSPTLPEEDDPGTPFFVSVQNAVMVAIECLDDRFVGSLSVPIFVYLDKGAPRGVLADVLGQENRAVVSIVVPDESANKAYEDIRRTLGLSFDPVAVFSAELSCEGSQDKSDRHNGMWPSGAEQANTF